MDTHKVNMLLRLKDWEFVNVCAEGLLNDVVAGCLWDDVYYSEHEIYEAYRRKFPDAPPIY